MSYAAQVDRLRRERGLTEGAARRAVAELAAAAMAARAANDWTARELGAAIATTSIDIEYAGPTMTIAVNRIPDRVPVPDSWVPEAGSDGRRAGGPQRLDVEADEALDRAIQAAVTEEGARGREAVEGD